jgi:hypothetical protein
MSNIYTRIRGGETLEVQFKVQREGQYAGLFEVGPLWMIGSYYVTEQSEWKRFAQVGGVVINGRRRVQMECSEMQSWCDELEDLKTLQENNLPMSDTVAGLLMVHTLQAEQESEERA